MNPSKGFTLVELVVSMLIISVIGVVGGSAFLQILGANEESRERSAAISAARFAIDEIRGVCSNLVPREIAGIPPYSEGADPDTGAPVHRFLTRLHEHSSRADYPEETQALLVEVKVAQVDENVFDLELAKTPIGYTGPTDDALEGLLSRNLQQFEINPKYGKDKDGPKTPEEFDFMVEYRLPNGERWSFRQEFVVRAAPPEKEKG